MTTTIKNYEGYGLDWEPVDIEPINVDAPFIEVCIIDYDLSAAFTVAFSVTMSDLECAMQHDNIPKTEDLRSPDDILFEPISENKAEPVKDNTSQEDYFYDGCC